MKPVLVFCSSFPSVKTDGKKKNWAKARADHSRMAGFIIHHLYCTRYCFVQKQVVILRAVQFCALPVSIEKGIRPHAFLPVG
ncbi:MAG: hypothetical protein LBB90_00165 [Tannerella sp.]|nr:hypothetical protein [Tannerella sp.]